MNTDIIFISLIEITIVFILFIFFYKKVPEFVFITLLVYTQLTGYISSVVVEYGAFITEIQESLYFNYASLVILPIIISPFLLFYLLSKFFFKYPKRLNNFKLEFTKIDKFLLLSSALALTVLMINVLISPNPVFDEGIRRFDFWDNAKFPFLRMIFGNLSLPILIIFSLSAFKIKYAISFDYFYKYIAYGGIVLYFIYLFLTGQKFNGFLIGIIFFMIPFIYLRKLITGIYLYKKELVFLSLFFIILITFKAISFSNSSGGVIDETGGSGLLAVFYRIFILQGYAFDFFILEPHIIDINEASDTLMHTAIYSMAANPEFYIENGINLANIFPGVLLTFEYGYFLIFVALLFFSIFTFILVSLIRKYLIHGYMLRTMISMQMLFWLIGGFPAGKYEVLYSSKFLLFLIILIFIETAEMASKAKQNMYKSHRNHI